MENCFSQCCQPKCSQRFQQSLSRRIRPSQRKIKRLIKVQGSEPICVYQREKFQQASHSQQHCLSPRRIPRDCALSTYGYHVIISPASLFIPFCEPRGEHKLSLSFEEEECMCLLFSLQLNQAVDGECGGSCNDGQIELFAQACLITLTVIWFHILYQ